MSRPAWILREGSAAEWRRPSPTAPASRTAQPETILAAALGAGQVLTTDAKGRKNGCKGGCGPCRACKQKGKQKRCVSSPDDTPYPERCNACPTRIDGTKECGATAVASCAEPCSSDIDCSPDAPCCATRRTDRATGQTTDLVFFCGLTSPGVCTRITTC